MHTGEASRALEPIQYGKKKQFRGHLGFALDTNPLIECTVNMMPYLLCNTYQGCSFDSLSFCFSRSNRSASRPCLYFQA